jgi:diguanylate cyclase (GGDEF)-like protein
VYDRPAVTSNPLLHAAIRATARGADVERSLDELLQIAMRVWGANAAAAFVWDAERGALAIAGSRHLDAEQVAHLEEGATRDGDPVRRAAMERVRMEGGGENGASMRLAAWPVVAGRDGVEEPLGALALIGGRALDDRDDGTADEIDAIADLIGLTIDRARMASDAGEHADWQERLAHSDALTGLANARTLARVIELEVARAARQASELCVAIFDVDDLTAINTDAGRAAGDDVLREVAAVVTESIRFVDTIARWGGDEFILVAPGATGTTVVRRIVEAVAARPAIAGRTFTVSAGLARFPIDGTTTEALVGAATAALRAAQATGPGTLAEVARDARSMPPDEESDAAPAANPAS